MCNAFIESTQAMWFWNMLRIKACFLEMSMIFQGKLSTDLWLTSESISQTWLASFTNGETLATSKVTAEINMVSNTRLCTQRKEPGSNYCPRFSKHGTSLGTNCCLPFSQAWSNALSPTNTSPEPSLHEKITHKMVRRPQPPHPVRSTRPRCPARFRHTHSHRVAHNESSCRPPPKWGRVSEARAAKLTSSHGAEAPTQRCLTLTGLSS